MPSEHVGRAVQARIYRAGVFGRHPSVPVNAAELERAAKRAMSTRAWSYVARLGRHGVDSAANRRRSTAGGSCRGCSRRRRPGHSPSSCSDGGCPRRCCSPGRRAGDGHRDADLAVARAAAALGVPMVFSTQASVADGGLRRRDGRRPRWFQLYWCNSDELVESLVGRAEAAGCEALVVTLDTHDAGLATARPRPRPPAVRAGQGHRAVHQRPGVPAAGRGAARPPAAAGPRPRGPTPARCARC